MDTEAAQRHLIDLENEYEQLLKQRQAIDARILSIRHDKADLYMKLHQAYRLKAAQA